MSTLLNIETSFLNSEKVKSLFKIKEAKKLKSNIEANDKKKFMQSVELAKIFLEAEQNFESEEGKRLFAESGLEWSKDEFFVKTYGYQKSYRCRLIKVAKLGDDKINEFNTYVDEHKNEGVSRSLQTILKWVKGEDVTSNGEGGGEESGEEGGEVNEVKCVFTLSFRRADIDGGKNIAVRVKSDGTVEGSSKEEIQFAIQFLQSKLA